MPDSLPVFANVQHLMIWDDHELRNDWGTQSQDHDTKGKDYRICLQARKAFWLYQRQLWDDIGDFDSRIQDLECSFHTYGQFGIMITDARGCRSFYRDDKSKRRYFGDRQWAAIESSLKPDGVFANCKCIILVHSSPPVFMGTWSSRQVGRISAQKDKMSLGLFPDEQCAFLDMILDWKKRNAGEVIMVGGDLHIGIETQISQENSSGEKAVVLRQIITSAISNSPPPAVIYWCLLRSFIGLSHGLGTPTRFTFSHTTFYNKRNFAYLENKIPQKKDEKASIDYKFVV
jgi:hypothetical protein